MRHAVSDDTLGVNHTLHVLNKPLASGLNDTSLRDSLRRTNPEFIYIHLGINDLLKGTPVRTIVSYLAEFSLFKDAYLPDSKIIYSLPLLTNIPRECRLILELRRLMIKWIEESDTRHDMEKRNLIFNSNSNFYREMSDRIRTSQPQATQEDGLFVRDGIHLSPKGKLLIVKNMRYVIHDICRRLLNKLKLTPHQRRPRQPRSPQPRFHQTRSPTRPRSPQPRYGFDLFD